jgi:hypothetical protein
MGEFLQHVSLRRPANLVPYPGTSESEIPFLVAHLSIFSGDGTRALDTVSGRSGERLLYGNLVSSPHRLRDLQGKQGVFFLFPDVSVRERGSYQLGVTLVSVARSVVLYFYVLGGRV